MKAIKKLLSIVMVLTLVLSLGASALAATVTMGGRTDAGSTYNAYQLLTAVFVRTDLTGDVYEYHINETFRAAIVAGVAAVSGDVKGTDGEVEPKPNNSDPKEYEKELMEFLTDLDADQIRQFADGAFAKITADKTPASATTDTGVFTDMEGYYLISETVSDTTNNAVTSLVMLDTIGKEDNITVTTKEDAPSSQKKVKDTNDQTGDTTDWQDSADWDIGDHVPYQLTATIQATRFDDYKTYYLEFQDRMCEGLTLDADSVHIYLNGTDITSSFTYSSVENPGDGYAVQHNWACYDIKDLGAKAGDKIVLEYTATLNDKAKIGSVGNPNDSRIEFSNNPYWVGEGKPDTGHTPWDKCIVFTYELDANKINGQNEPLEGAEFTLYKKVADSFEKEGAEFVGLDASKGYEETIVAPGNKYQKFVLSAQNDGKGNLTFFSKKGLDDGQYIIVETKVPEGYNKADPIEFTISADHTNDPNELKLGSFKADKDILETGDGVLSTDIQNLTGLELPETGGIGTTIFYVIGAVLVAAAVVLLVTKKRVNGAEK